MHSILQTSTTVLFLSLFILTSPAFAQECPTQKNISFSLDFNLGYDFLSKFEKVDVNQNDTYTENTLSTSKKFANYIDLQLSFNALSEHTRFTILGLGFILPRSLDNKVSFYYREDESTSPVDQVKIDQKLNFGIYLQLIKFGYRISLNSVELIPYIGLNVLCMRAQLLDDDSPSKTDYFYFYIPAYTGIDVLFAKLGSFNFFAGLEFGRAFRLKSLGDKNDIIDPNPLTGYTGKLSLGSTYTF